MTRRNRRTIRYLRGVVGMRPIPSIRATRPARSVATALVALAVGSTAAAQVAAPAGRLLELTIPAPALEGNVYGDPTEQRVSIYLPPGYEDTTERYPVLYLLHGILGSPEDWTEPGYRMTIQGVMDSLVALGEVREMIVVVPNGTNRVGGSFYVDSEVSGDWEGWIARDVVGYVDGNYRTIASAGGRGIAGHSMGGFGAVWLAMRNPDVFSAAYALSPAVLGIAGDLGAGGSAWSALDGFGGIDELWQALEQREFYPIAAVAVAAAMSPNPDNPPMYVDLPFVDSAGRRVPLEPGYSRWQASVPIAQIDRYRENLLELRALYLDYGFFDQFSHIPETTQEFSNALAERGIPHVLEVYEGDHRDRMRWRMSARVLPMFSRVLDGG